MLSANLLAQERSRRATIATLQRLRREARNEIARLIQFLDQSDPYVMTELEDDDEREPDDEAEDGADDEPSLGSSGHEGSGAICYLHRAISDGCDLVYDCEGDEHDGREPDDSGIGDIDGLLEQVGTQDWQRGGMA
jgi:hypothetical protein